MLPARIGHICSPAVQVRASSLTSPCGSDGLTILLVLDISRSEHSTHAGLCSAWRGHNVPLLICQKLSRQEFGGWLMTDCKEEPIHLVRTGQIKYGIPSDQNNIAKTGGSR